MLIITSTLFCLLFSTAIPTFTFQRLFFILFTIIFFILDHFYDVNDDITVKFVVIDTAVLCQQGFFLLFCVLSRHLSIC